MGTQHNTLGELLYEGLQYDSSWGIYAFGTGVDSPARIGQTQFEQGGILDGMSFIIDGVRLGDAWLSYLDYPTDEEYEDAKSAIGADEFLDFLSDGWIEYDNPDCYQTDPGCPKCGGAMYGADFPNGDGYGTCVCCGLDAEWDNDLAEWKQEESA